MNKGDIIEISYKVNKNLHLINPGEYFNLEFYFIGVKEQDLLSLKFFINFNFMNSNEFSDVELNFIGVNKRKVN